jgi:hypothetical protein
MIDDGEWECETLNCLFGKYEEEDDLYKKSYKDKHKSELNTTKQKPRKELKNESIINSKGSSMDK